MSMTQIECISTHLLFTYVDSVEDRVCVDVEEVPDCVCVEYNGALFLGSSSV